MVLVALSKLARLPKVVVAFVLVLLIFRKPLPKAPPVADDVVEDNGDAAATLLVPPVSNAGLPPIELTDPKVAATDGVIVLVVPAAALARLPKPPVVVVALPKPPL